MFVGRSVSTHQRRPASGVRVNQIAPSLPQMFILINLKSRRINTYRHLPCFAAFRPKSSPRNPFTINISEKQPGNSFKCNIYKKREEEGALTCGDATRHAPLEPGSNSCQASQERRSPVLSFPREGKVSVG